MRAFAAPRGSCHERPCRRSSCFRCPQAGAQAQSQWGPLWQVALSLALSVATVLGMLWVTAKIFRVALLSYGALFVAIRADAGLPNYGDAGLPYFSC